jgi:hypothetical protein
MQENVPNNAKELYEDTTIDARTFLPVHLVRFGTRQREMRTERDWERKGKEGVK